MSIQTIIAALQARHALVTGVVSAPTAYPGSLPAANLPLVLTDLTTFEEHQEAHDEDAPVFDGVFRVRGFCLPSNLGQGIDEGRQKALTVLDALLANYRGDAGLTTTAFIRSDVKGSTRGRVVNDLPYGDQAYYGFEIMVLVQERFG